MKLAIANHRVVHEVIDGEVVILDRINGHYFSITGSGVDAWQVLARPSTPEDVVAAVAGACGTSPHAVDAVIRALVARLEHEGLIGPATEAPPPASEVPADAGGARPAARAFVAPTLEKYTDLEKLLLLDPIHEVDTSGWPRTRPADPE